MKIVPFKNIVLVRPIKKANESKSGIVLPNNYQSRFVRHQVLAIGPDVNWISVEDIVIANPTPEDEVVNEQGDKLINSHDIIAREEQDGE